MPKQSPRANDYTYDRFKPPARPGKPRETGLTIIADNGPDDRGWTGFNGAEDLLTAASDYLDYAKIAALSAIMLPHDFVKRMIRLYRDYDVTPFCGGLLYELAYLQNAEDELVTHLKRIDAAGLEISENYITLDVETRNRAIERFRREGFAVVYEFGRKHPAEAMRIETLERIVMEMVELGVDHVIVEQGEIDKLAEDAPQTLAALPQQPWFPKIVLEPDSDAFPQQHVQMIEDYGPAVNLCNVRAGQIIQLEGYRLGLGRKIKYRYLSDLVEGA
jgi:phosphosulfolactate synthase